MPQFKLTLIDSNGRTRTTTVEAANKAGAIALVRGRGYQVTQVEQLYDEADEGVHSLPPEEEAYYQPPSPRPARRPTPAASRPAGSGKGLARFAAFLSFLALGAGVTALVFVYLRTSPKTEPDAAAKADAANASIDFFGTGMSNYDFSTPEKALDSDLKIDARMDIRAKMEYQKRIVSKKAQERVDSFKIDRVVDHKPNPNGGGPPGAVRPSDADDWKELKVVFFTVKEGGKTRFMVRGYYKDSDSGLWAERYFSEYDAERQGNKTLGDDIRQWKAREGGKN